MHILCIVKNIKFSGLAVQNVELNINVYISANPTRRKRRSQSSRTHASLSCSTSGEECGSCPWTDNASYRTLLIDSMRYRMNALRLRLHVPSTSPFFVPFQKWVQCSPMMLLTHNIKKIKGAVHKNGDTDCTCKRSLILQCFLYHSHLAEEIKVA